MGHAGAKDMPIYDSAFKDPLSVKVLSHMAYMSGVVVCGVSRVSILRQSGPP